MAAEKISVFKKWHVLLMSVGFGQMVFNPKTT